AARGAGQRGLHPVQRHAGGPRLDGLGVRPQAAPRGGRPAPGARRRGAHRRPRPGPACPAAARPGHRGGRGGAAGTRRRPRPGPADDETLLVQSGRPVGVMRTHEWAPRVLIANSNLVGEWATWEEFRRLEALGLTMYGQMTAGSWIYIGTQGILQGTYET